MKRKPKINIEYWSTILIKWLKLLNFGLLYGQGRKDGEEYQIDLDTKKIAILKIK